MKTEDSITQETLEDLRAILCSIGDAIIVTDRKGRIRHLNPEAKRLTGWNEVDAKGKELRTNFRHLVR
ncbi:MAG: PAS domain-containing protein [Syntrophales bacterium]|nr:PAS domain-containing protein [Syntrophales bacterium]